MKEINTRSVPYYVFLEMSLIKICMLPFISQLLHKLTFMHIMYGSTVTVKPGLSHYALFFIKNIITGTLILIAITTHA